MAEPPLPTLQRSSIGGPSTSTWACQQPVPSFAGSLAPPLPPSEPAVPARTESGCVMPSSVVAADRFQIRKSQTAAAPPPAGGPRSGPQAGLRLSYSYDYRTVMHLP